MSERDIRAERLQEVLDHLSDGVSVDDVLLRLNDDKDLADDLLLALQMKSSLPIAPSAEFRARSQVELQGLMSSAPPASGRWRRMLPRLAGAIAALVLVLWSAVVVSADSLPGDALYGVKLASERAQLVLAVNPAARARLYLDLADRRLSELEEMADLGLPLPSSLVDDLVEAQGMAIDQAEISGDASLVHEAEQSALQASRAVGIIAKEAPQESRDVLEAAGSAMSLPEAPLGGPPDALATATAQTGPILTDESEATVDVPSASDETTVPSPTTKPSQASTITATAAAAPPTAETGATIEPLPTGTPVPPTDAPTATSEAEPDATLPPSISAQFTERSRDLTREAEPTATRTPGSGRRHMAPTAEPTAEPSGVPTDQLDPPSTATAGP